MKKETLLEIKNLKVSFGPVAAVEDVSFTIDKGQCVALVGESGSGKTVTSLSILKLLPVCPSGKIYFNNQELLSLSEKDLRAVRGRKIAMIFQEPMTSLNPLHSIGKQIIEVLELHDSAKSKNFHEQAVELLRLAGLPDAAERFNALPHELSGGQRQRVMIAMALAGKPDLLIADEPTTALDVTIQAQIINLLKDLQKRFGMAILFISHDLSVVKRIASFTHVMKNGKIIESGPTEDILQNPREPYTRELVNTIPSIIRKKLPDNAPFIVQVKDFEAFYGKFKALDKISLNIRKGSTFGLVGESGSGKTTLGLGLLKLITTRGDLIFNGKSIPDLKAMHPLRRNMQIVFQDPFSSLNPRMDIEQIVGEGLEVYTPKTTRQERRKTIIDTLEKTGLSRTILNRYPHEFSGGQRQRIAIARALVLRPEFLILDEPTSALDISVQAQIVELLHNLKNEFNLSYLLITHDMKVIKALADYIAVMKNGRIIEFGSNEDIFTNPKHDYTKGLISSAFI